MTSIDPPRIHSTSPIVTHANLTGRMELHCRATGFPLPDLTWSHPRDSTGKVMSSGSHFLVKNISKYDQGQYRCRASNAAGITEKVFTLFINGMGLSFLIYFWLSIFRSVRGTVSLSDFWLNCLDAYKSTKLSEIKAMS